MDVTKRVNIMHIAKQWDIVIIGPQKKYVISRVLTKYCVPTATNKRYQQALHVTYNVIFCLHLGPVVNTPSMTHYTGVRLQNLPWSKTGLVSRQVLDPLSKLQNWIRSKTGRYKTGLVSNTKIEASPRATKPKPWQSNLTSDTVEIFIQNEKAGLVPMQSRFRSRHKAGFGAAGLGTAQSWFWSRHKASFGAVSRPV